ncbi:ribosome-recycling factor, mitochondrial-like [Oppia nitens]|uniref:ribosome-recycling factor, mitochondrial-like n=1 Tax=Oppia nitens TaxID=1686743 RepID=UPI0023DAD890|nr:ribosome-recycling factor, mitochondrial-like [Oppia nitens]
MNRAVHLRPLLLATCLTTRAPTTAAAVITVVGDHQQQCISAISLRTFATTVGYHPRRRRSSSSSVQQQWPLLTAGYCGGQLVNYTSVRSMAKNRDKPKDTKQRKGVKPKVVLTDDEMTELIPISELKIELSAVVDRLRNDLTNNVCVRSNPQAIDSLVIDINGAKHQLNELAPIIRKSPQLVVINLGAMPEAVKPVLAAMAESGMNLNPQQEGNVLYVTIPKVTREHREGLAGSARQLCQKARQDIKDIHSTFATYVRKQRQRSHVSEDLVSNVNDNLKYLIDGRLSDCDQLLNQKLDELLK